jgi:2'-5' RNA ligase
VAVTVDAAELTRLRGRLATIWQEWLSAQDRQGYRPHVTIQNKVSSDQARRLYDQLAAQWEPFTGRGEGLLLWRYMGGPWEPAGEFLFGETD